MTLSYGLRLLSSSLACWFLVNFVAGAIICWRHAALLQWADALTPQQGARLVFTFRLLPSVLATFFIAAFCVPSFLRLETSKPGEVVGPACLLLAGCALLLFAEALIRFGRAAIITHRQTRLLVDTAVPKYIAGWAVPVFVSANPRVRVALAGLFSPKLLLSKEVLEGLTPSQLVVTLRHEARHARSGDNLKRAAMLLAPGFLPFCNAYGALRRAWVRLTEWAADDEASGSAQQARLSLAESILAVARMQHMPPQPFWTALIEDERELKLRLARLFMPPSQGPPSFGKATCAVVEVSLLLGAITVCVEYSSILRWVHAASEGLIH
jgi:hypothetical protein